jgi:hypothetical protein
MGLPAAYRKARAPAPRSRYCGASDAPDMRFSAAWGDARGRVQAQATREPATHCAAAGHSHRAPRAGHSHRALRKGFADVVGRGNSPGSRAAKRDRMDNDAAAYLRGANTGFQTRRRVNGGADGPRASRVDAHRRGKPAGPLALYEWIVCLIHYSDDAGRSFSALSAST